MGVARGDPPPVIRVHRVIARLNVGGPAMHVTHLSSALDEHGFRTRLLAGAVGPEEGDMTYFARERGVEVTVLRGLGREVHPGRDLRTLWRMVRIFLSDRPHVVHTHTAKAGALGRVAARLAGVPVVAHTYHGHVLGGGYFSRSVTDAYRAVERQLGRISDALVTLTPGLAQELAEVHSVAPPHRFRVIPLGLELGRFHDQARPTVRRRIRAELGIPDTAPVIGVVGRLVSIKNHELLLDALARVRRVLPDARLWVVGGGERESALRKHAAALGVAEAVRWLGWRDDLERIYPGMDVVALSSRDEGTPVALLEAMAAGLPIVATRVGGVPEMMEKSGYPGHLVPPGSGSALAQALRQVLESGRRAPVDPAASRRVVDRHSVARLAADTGSLYRELLARAGFPDGAGLRSSRP